MRQFACIRFGLSALLASTALCTPAAAQLVPPSPIKPTVDSNGVDLFDGKLNVRTPALTIGSNVPQGLAYYKYSRSGSGWSDNIIASLNLSGTTMTARFGEITDRFTVSGSSYISMEGNGSTLTFNGTTNVYTYTRADGTVIHFDKAYSTPSPYYSNEGRASDVIDPSGAKLAYSYDTFRYCDKWKPLQGEEVCIHHSYAFRVKTVRNSYGYQLTLNYAAYSPDPDAFDADLWSKVVGATATNLAVASGASTPSLNFSETYGINTYTLNATDPQGRVSKYRVISGGLVVGITLPGSAAEDMTIGYTSGRVTSVVKPAGTTNYSSSDASGIRTVTVTDPLSNATVYKFNIATERLTSITDANGRTRSMQYDSSRRLTRVTEPEGNYTQFTYDARGNVTEQRSVAKAGSGLADIVLTAGYSATCSNPKTCNQPNWTKDAKGNQTDFTYDSGHGGVLTATSPATAAGGVRPQTRFGYTSLQAYFKVSGSTITASGEPITLLTSTSTCQSLATCTGTADEVKSTVNYGPQLSGTGNNLLPVSMSKGAGDNSLTATTSLTYDDVGNLTYVDGPLPGTVDVTRALYNLDREMVGAIGPDPDGAGPLKNRSRRITIDSRGLVTKTESGTTNGQTDPDWAGFVAAEAVEVAYDSSRRPTVNSLTSGGTTYALTQTSYDAVGRPECVATRMNPATFGSLPASACTLGTTGSFGSDRITKTVYDAAGQITQNQVAVGTADAATERTLTYTNNGRLQTLKDAENNLTTYEYDGHDRLSKTRYPLPTQGSNASSTTDYEQLGYDAASNVTSRRLRDATSIVLGYDNLGRVTSKDLPGTEPDVTYAYDNLGRLTSASQTGNALSFTYDALSRNLTQVGPQGTVASQWDLAGRRTKLTYPGSGLYIDYDYLVTGETTKLRENGATSGVGVLATYAYDDLGRRTGLTFGNGAVQAYSYDPVSRLASLTNDLSGTGSDLSQTLAYNPASQITSAVRTGDAYAWTGHFNENKAGTPNGLNQLTQVGAKALTHDARGNVTAFGTKSFTYSSENLLLTGPNGTSLGYDPVMRLQQAASGGATTNLTYDGLDRIAEYDGSSNLLRRYVHGPSVDEPLVWYEGIGTTDRRFLGSDERGSIISVTDSAGAVLGLNKYDEYGNPQSTNLGIWGYTGQAWLPTMGVWYYKARDYDPELGRFLQTDPIGYGDGPNWYAYAHNDPVGRADPSGSCASGFTAEPGSRICMPDDGQGGPTSSSGGTALGGGGVQGGPLSGLPCTGCLSPEDKRAQDSIDFWGGYYAGNVWVSTRQPAFSLGRWFTTPTRNDITGTSFCWKACGPNGLEQYPTYSPAQQATTLGAYAGLLVGFGFLPELGSALGPSGPIFGDTAFGASNQGVLNVGRLRLGFGRGGGVANFRLGFDNNKIIFFTRPNPMKGTKP